MTGTLGALMLVLVGVTLLLHLNSTSERSQTQIQDAGAWSQPTPTIGEAWYSEPLTYQDGYEDGWTDHKNGESFGGDR